MQFQSLGWEDPLEKEMAAHFSILTWRTPWAMVHGVTKSWTRLKLLSSWNTHIAAQGKRHFTLKTRGFPRGSVVKNAPTNAVYPGLIPGLGRSPGKRNGNPFQYFYWDRGVWQLQAMGSQKVGHDRDLRTPGQEFSKTQNEKKNGVKGTLQIFGQVLSFIFKTILILRFVVDNQVEI